MKKIVKFLLLALLVLTSATSGRIFAAETRGEFQVQKNAKPAPTPTPKPTPTPSLPKTSRGSGVVSASKLPVTGEQVATWSLFVGLILVAVVLFFLILKRLKENEASQHQPHA